MSPMSNSESRKRLDESIARLEGPEHSAESDALNIEEMFDAIDAAYAAARALHDAGRCHESEWSCSHCERESLLGGDDYEDADLDPRLPRLLAEARRAATLAERGQADA